MLNTTFLPFPYLETKRLSLWQLEKSDAAGILALRSSDRINQYIDRKRMATMEEAEFFITKINENIEKGECIFWAVADKLTNDFLGTVCLWNIIKDGNKAELGYELLHHAQGKGYMNELLPAVIEYGFRSIQVDIIEAVIKTGNERSIKLAEKMGFTFSRMDNANLIYSLAK